MTADEIKDTLAKFDDGIGFVQENLTPSILEASAAILNAASMQKMADVCTTVKDLETGGQLDKLRSILQKVQDRRIVLWIAGRFLGGEPSTASHGRKRFEDFLQAIADDVGAEEPGAEELKQVLALPKGLRRFMILRRMERHAAPEVELPLNAMGEGNWQNVDWAFWAKVLLQLFFLLAPVFLAEEPEGDD